MKTICFLSIAFLTTVVVSCNSGIDNSEDRAAATPAPTPQPQQITLPQQPAANTPAAGTSAALNPAHGQPGHRCELPVGAPLNTAPANPAAAGTINPMVLPANGAAPTINSSPQPLQNMPVLPKGNAGSSTARLNPAHGQPGHDCSVPVGQPLK